MAGVIIEFNVGKLTVHDVIRTMSSQFFLMVIEDGDCIKKRRIVI